MKSNFFGKMAWRNIRSNQQLYVPYILSSVMTVAMFMMMASLMTNEFVRERSAMLPQLFAMGVFVIGIFSLIFIFYTNSFLMKRRKKELGLYSILGMEKKHVARVIAVETLIVGGVSTFAGILVGMLFGRLIFLFLNYLLQMPTIMGYSFSIETIGITLGMFFITFLLTLIYNIAQITFSNPIKLLKGGRTGEKEPKSSPLLFLLGLISLGSGYWISLTIEDPISALTQFFLAVLFVIVGTYLLFNAGSIIVLKALKKNKSFYYRPGPFISVSGMLYRMKQHATGLANISILSVMVIIAVSTTVTLFVGTEETLSNRFPEENNVTVHTPEEMTGEQLKEQIELFQNEVVNKTRQTGFEIENHVGYRYMDYWGQMNNDEFQLRQASIGGELPSLAIVIPLEDFNEASGNQFSLDDNELLVRAAGTEFNAQNLTIGNNTFEVTLLEELPFFLDANVNLVETYIIIAPTVDVIDTISANFAENPENVKSYWKAELAWGVNGPDEHRDLYADQIRNLTNEVDLDVGIFYESRDANREEWYSMNGGFLFLGIFLGSLFIIGSVLITYFKQISEGFDDRERVQIMQKVGLDKVTTRKATRYQVVWMFSLPLLVAVLHTAFAFPILQKMLILFGITSSQLLIACTLGVVFVYALIYWIIYRVTSKVYLNIVE